MKKFWYAILARTITKKAEDVKKTLDFEYCSLTHSSVRRMRIRYICLIGYSSAKLVYIPLFNKHKAHEKTKKLHI